MKLPFPISVGDLAQKIGADLHGDDSLFCLGLNEIHNVAAGDATFSDAPKYFEKCLSSAATVLILSEKPEKIPVGKAILVCPRPFEAFDGLVREFSPPQILRSAVSHLAEIDPTAVVEPGAIVAPTARIGPRSRIGANSVIGEKVEIGADCLIGSNCSVGSEAFYFKKKSDGTFEKWACGGRVVIGDRVDLGPGSTVARGVTGDTTIGDGSKLDAQIHLGHEVKIGKNCLFAAQVGIGGNTRIGDGVVLYGQVGIAQNLEIGAGAVVLAKSGVSKNLAGGKTYFGYPAEETRLKYRELAALRHLPSLLKKMDV